MILHCYYCALGGDHRTSSSEVAIVDEKALCKPLRADMFKPLKPQHDNTAPFQSDEWRFMRHRACGRYPWPYDVDPQDGPSRMLTDKGFVEIPGAYQGSTTSISGGGTSERSTPSQPTVLECTCKVCGKVCKSPLGLNSHKRSHK